MDKGCEEIPQQGMGLRNLQTLRKVVAIYKINILVFFKK